MEVKKKEKVLAEIVLSYEINLAFDILSHMNKVNCHFKENEQHVLSMIKFKLSSENHNFEKYVSAI